MKQLEITTKEYAKLPDGSNVIFKNMEEVFHDSMMPYAEKQSFKGTTKKSLFRIHLRLLWKPKNWIMFTNCLMNEITILLMKHSAVFLLLKK